MNRSLIILAFLLMNCKHQNDNFSETPLFEYLENFDAHPENSVTVVYLHGCNGCHELYKIILETIPVNQKNSIFILTKSPKKAKLLFGDELISRVIFDKDFLAFKYSLIENFPVIYRVHKGKLIESTIIKSVEDLYYYSND